MTRPFVAALATIAAASAISATTPASAQGRAAVGQLVCSSRGGIGLIIVSQKSFSCQFKPTRRRPVQNYTASVTNLGIDLGVTGSSVLVWTVLSASSNLGPGVLAGYYTGVGADASIGVGAGANLLVGGSGNSISLQPLSAQAQTGLNIAAGIKGLQLRAR